MKTFRRIKAILFTGLIALVLPLSTLAWAEVIITPQGIDAKVKDYILKTTPLDDPSASLHVKTLKTLSDPIVLNGDHVKFMFDDSRPVPLTFRTIVQVTISTDEETKNLGIPVQLSIERPVWVATHLIRARQPITLKDVMLQRKTLDLKSPYTLGKNDSIAAYTSQINITPGSILDIRTLKMTPAVYRNDDVRLILSMASGVKVSIYGKAMEDGAIGTKIRVEQRLSNNTLRAYNGEVIGRDVVQVNL